MYYFKGVHAHASAALINFCEGAEQDTLLPYLDPIVECLLNLLNSSAGNPPMVWHYVQEQAITTLVMVTNQQFDPTTAQTIAAQSD